MTPFRVLLATIIATVGIYTFLVIGQHGVNFLVPFFRDFAEMGWAGQFNMDFASLLVLASVWLMWRHHFSPLGIIFGIVLFAGGAPFLCSYLLVVLAKDKADIAELFLGKSRVAALKQS